MSHRSRRCRTLQQPRRRARLALGVPAGATVVGAGGPADLSEGSRGLYGCPGRTRPSRSDRSMDWRRELAERVASMAKSTRWVHLILAGDRADVPDLLPAFDVFALPQQV